MIKSEYYTQWNSVNATDIPENEKENIVRVMQPCEDEFFRLMMSMFV